jgi:hypothetical protein
MMETRLLGILVVLPELRKMQFNGRATGRKKAGK